MKTDIKLHVWAAAGIICLAVIAAGSVISENIPDGPVKDDIEIAVKDAGIAATVIAELRPILPSLDATYCDSVSPPQPCACGDIGLDGKCGSGVFDVDALAETHRGQRLHPVPLLDDTRPSIMDADLNPRKIDHEFSKIWVSVEDAKRAIAESPWQHQLIGEDVGFWAIKVSEFERVLREGFTVQLIAYTLCSADEPQTGKGCFVCRNYAELALDQYAKMTGSDAGAKILDFKGRHSYNSYILIDDETGDEVYWVVEPQASRRVVSPNEARHYSGSGIAMLGG